MVPVHKQILLSLAALILVTLVAPIPAVMGGEPAKPKPRTDESLTSKEYIALGLPAYDREWSGDDMVKAHEVLSKLADTGFRQLPGYKSERSGKVFARMTSPQNLDLFRNRSLPLKARFPQALNHFQASGQFLKLYVSAFVEKETRDCEIVELMGAVFRSTMVMLELVDEFLPTLDKEDPSYEVRLEGLEQMRRGLASVVSGGLLTLTERSSYSSTELARLVGYMQETFPLIVPQLPPGARSETMIQLKKLQGDSAMKDLQPLLEKLRGQVENSLGR